MRVDSAATFGGWSKAVLDVVDHAGRKTSLVVLCLILFPFLLHGIRVSVSGFPYPLYHDEFSYLLGADTFACGRLANPVHPFFRHFETMHVLSIPAYASKYPPGQALALAMGQVMLGHPYWGVVLGLSFAWVSCFYALRQWTNPGFALIGAVSAALYFGTWSYWARSYWGGALCFGAALLAIGAYREFVTRRTAKAGWILGLGFALMFFTRPYEGGVLGFGIGVALLLHGYKERAVTLSAMAKHLGRAATVLSAALLFQVAINLAVTGNPLRMPYAEHTRQYVISPLLWPLPQNPIEKSANRSLRAQQEWELNGAETLLQGGPVNAFLTRILITAVFCNVLLPFLWVGRDKDSAVLTALGLLCILSLSVEVWAGLHYFAPLLAVLWCCQYRAYWLMSRDGASANPKGQAISLSLIGLIALVNLTLAATTFTGLTFADAESIRERVERRLRESKGRDLVFVRRGEKFNQNVEFVFNPANIDNAEIVWAHDLGDVANRDLIDLYKDRRAWLLLPESVSSDGAAGTLRELPRPEAAPTP